MKICVYDISINIAFCRGDTGFDGKKLQFDTSFLQKIRSFFKTTFLWLVAVVVCLLALVGTPILHVIFLVLLVFKSLYQFIKEKLH